MFARSDDYDRSTRPVLNTGKGLTKQSMRDECDINVIMKKYAKTGLTNFVSARKGEYMEVPNIDFHEAMNLITKSNEMFDDMPSELRKRFRNDPGEFMDFVHDPNNLEEMYSLGLAQRPPEEAPPVVVEGETPTTPPGDGSA